MSKVLVVEDKENQRALYEQELTDDGYEVTLAADGYEAMDMLKASQPDIVVLDISMPGMDGIEVLGKILTENNRLPVILHTAYRNFKDNFMTWAADAYVVKNSDLGELKNRIKELLRERQGGEVKRCAR
jgi:DNA-binding response OmpR family regulator